MCREITHRCPSFSGSAWPMHIPLRDDLVSNCRLVTQTSLFRYDMWIPWTVAIFFSKSKCLLPSRTTYVSSGRYPDTVIQLKNAAKWYSPWWHTNSGGVSAVELT
ncbi:hypothetical protein TNCV_1170461 [Trichonephila clavipes]|nr:hypothetical protein TNCV_1170461 [Trichonephila clavipes]